MDPLVSKATVRIISTYIYKNIMISNAVYTPTIVKCHKGSVEEEVNYFAYIKRADDPQCAFHQVLKVNKIEVLKKT